MDAPLPHESPPASGTSPEPMSAWATLRELISMLTHYRAKSALFTFALVVEVAYDTALPLALKALIDFAIEPKNVQVFVVILCVLGAAFLVSSVCAVWQDYLYGWLGAHVLHDLRLRLFHHIQRLSIEYFGRAKPGDVLARFSTDLAGVEHILVIGLPGAFVSFLGILASCAALFALQWQLALLLLAAAPFCLLGPRLLGPRALRAGYRMREEQAVLTNLVQENLSAQKIIKAFSLRESAIARFSEQSVRIRKSGMSFGFLCYSTERSPNIGMAFFNVLVLAGGGFLAIRGHLTVGALVSFHALFSNVSASVLTLSEFVPTLLHSSGGLQRIMELLDEPGHIAELPNALVLEPLRESIRLGDVAFRYAGQPRGLEGVSLEIPKGARVAFVGPSGCGKSTCLQLILRFFDPAAGSVTFDGVDLRDVTLDSLSAQVGVVFQDNFLFNTSILENVRMGRPEATDAEVEEACRLADLHDLVMTMPLQYDTLAGDGGNRLSGGQRQRVAIARALIRRPSILLLDEATSALDPATESAINATLDSLAGQHTMIAVTHRLQPLTGYDRIFVFQDGRCVEAGTHRELLAQRGLYAELWAKQNAIAISADFTEATLDPESLARVAIFAKLDAPLRQQVADMLRVEEYPTGTTVFQEGEEGDKFYVVARGRARVTSRGADGTERTIAVIQDGDSFGELALLHHAPRNASVTTEAPTIVLTLRRAAFHQLLEKYPGVRDAVLSQAHQRETIIRSAQHAAS